VSSCGAQLGRIRHILLQCRQINGSDAAHAAAGRIAPAVRLLGILWLASSALRLIPGLFFLRAFAAEVFAGRVAFVCPRAAPCWERGSCSAPEIGCRRRGLLAHHRGQRMLTIFSSISLVDIPSPASRIYTLWVLLPAESSRNINDSERGARA